VPIPGPFPIGHECVGEVVAIGESVLAVTVDDVALLRDLSDLDSEWTCVGQLDPADWTVLSDCLRRR